MSRYLFEGIDEIEARMVGAAHVLLCLDYDGTLTPLVAHPDLAILSPRTRQTLLELSEQPNMSLAIVSGRASRNVEEFVAIPHLIYAGNHGLEIAGPGMNFVDSAAVTASPALHGLAADLTHKLSHLPGVFLEDKGLTLSVHYRLADETAGDEIKRIVHATLAAENHPYNLVPGSKIYEIRPRLYWDKGTAVKWIADRLGKEYPLIIFVGDDATDEDAFATLTDGITVKVGDPTSTAAAHYVEGPGEVLAFLEWLRDRGRNTSSRS